MGEQIGIANIFSFLLVSASIINAVDGVFSVKLLIDTVKTFTRISHNFTIEMFPEDLSLNETLAMLKNMTDRVNDQSYSFDRNALKLLSDSGFELLKYGDPQNISGIMQEFTSSFIDIDVRYLVLSDVMHMDYVKNIEIIDSHFEKLIASNIIEECLKSMYRLVNGLTDRSPNLFLLMAEYIEKYESEPCSRRKLTQAHIQSLYNIIFDKELKGSFLSISAYTHLTRRGISNYHHAIESTKKDAKHRFRTYYMAAREALEKVPIEILACDKEHYVKNENYIELSGMTRGFILDSGALETNISNCEINEPTNDYCNAVHDLCFGHHCSALGGKLSGCRDLHTAKLTLCSIHEYPNRYSWMKSDDKTYGNYTQGEKCHGSLFIGKSLSNGKVQQVDSNLPHGDNSFCFCNCEREKWMPGDIRAISLVWEVASTGENKVITNLKFKEKNGLIRLHMQTGRILRGGIIEQDSVSWEKHHPSFPETDPNSNSPIYIFNQTEEGEPILLRKWYEERDFAYVQKNISMNLDDIILPKNYVVIGVAMVICDSAESEFAIELRVLGMEFNYKTGKLNHDKVKSISGSSAMKNELGHIDRELFNPGSPGDPLRMHQNNVIRSRRFQYVEFQQTNWEKDLGQTIVPFIDTRPLVIGEALALSGIGIYARGCKDCGGIIGPKLFIYNYTHHFEREYKESYLNGDIELQ